MSSSRELVISTVILFPICSMLNVSAKLRFRVNIGGSIDFRILKSKLMNDRRYSCSMRSEKANPGGVRKTPFAWSDVNLSEFSSAVGSLVFCSVGMNMRLELMFARFLGGR